MHIFEYSWMYLKMYPNTFEDLSLDIYLSLDSIGGCKNAYMGTSRCILKPNRSALDLFAKAWNKIVKKIQFVFKSINSLVATHYL